MERKRKRMGRLESLGEMRREKRKEGRHGGHKEWTVSDPIHCRGFCLRGMLVVGDRGGRAAPRQIRRDRQGDTGGETGRWDERNKMGQYLG
jgi:hypothetical protein